MGSNILEILFIISITFSFSYGSFEFTTIITTATRYLVVLETYHNSFSIHLLKFHLENEENEITYVHQLFSPKDLILIKNVYHSFHWVVSLAIATEEETDIYTLKSKSDRVGYSIKDREFLFSFVVEEDTEEGSLSEQQEDHGLDVATNDSSYKIKAELYTPIPGVKLDVLPPTPSMSFLVESNFEPLPKKFVKEIIASFTIFPDEETLVVAKAVICLPMNSFRAKKRPLISMQIYKQTIVQGHLIKMKEKVIKMCDFHFAYTVERKAILFFASDEFELDVRFSINLLTFNVEKVFLSLDSEGLEMKFNGQLVVQDNKKLILVEEFLQTIKGSLVAFKTVKIPFFYQPQLKTSVTCFFPIIQVVSTSLCVEISFVWLQELNIENENIKGLRVNSELFLLDFSKRFCAHPIAFYSGNLEFELILLLALNNEALRNGHYLLTLDYKLHPFGISFIKEEKVQIFLDLYNLVTDQLSVETVVESYVLGDSTSLGQNYLYLGKVREKEKIPTLSKSTKKFKLVSKFYRFAGKLLQLRILFKKVKIFEYTKTVNKLAEKMRSVIKNYVPNLYLFAYDYYYSLNEEEQKEKLGNWNELLEETEIIMKHWKEIKESDFIAAFAKLIKMDQEDDPSLYSLVKEANQRIMDACNLISRIA